MAAPVNRVYNYLCEGENLSIDRNLLMGDPSGFSFISKCFSFILIPSLQLQY